MVVVKSKIKYAFYPPRFTFCKAELMLIYFISLSIVNIDFSFHGGKDRKVFLKKLKKI